jgi:inorganic pyrophosphatase/exopolyphosphatase
MSNIGIHIQVYDNVQPTGQQFVNAAKLDLQSEKQRVFVIGNQAGDLDTIVSALATAYLESKVCKDSDRVFIPLMPFARDDFRLRGDSKKIFEQAGFTFDSHGAPSSLIFYDEVDFAQGSQKSAVILTDHNMLHPGYVDHFPGGVLKIIDHHKNESAHPDAELHLDDSGGSACTLIVELFKESKVLIPCDLAILLLGTIVVDTRNFDLKKHIFNERDAAAVIVLEALLFPAADGGAGAAADGAGDRLSVRQQWFNELIEARYDVSDLSVPDLLKLDYKQAELHTQDGAKIQVGFAALFITPGEMVERAGGAQQVVDDMQVFCRTKGLHVLLGMTKEDTGALSGGKGFLVTSTAEGSEADMQLAQGLAAAITEGVAQAPSGLSAELLALPLFQRQGISAGGFDFATVDQYPPLSCHRLSFMVTRKTMLPAATHFAQKHLDATATKGAL